MHNKTYLVSSGTVSLLSSISTFCLPLHSSLYISYHLLYFSSVAFAIPTLWRDEISWLAGQLDWSCPSHSLQKSCCVKPCRSTNVYVGRKPCWIGYVFTPSGNGWILGFSKEIMNGIDVTTPGPGFCCTGLPFDFARCEPNIYSSYSY